MWYFSWILGVGLACAFAVLNSMWFEMREDAARDTAEHSRRSASGDT